MNNKNDSVMSVFPSRAILRVERQRDDFYLSIYLSIFIADKRSVNFGLWKCEMMSMMELYNAAGRQKRL